MQTRGSIPRITVVRLVLFDIDGTLLRSESKVHLLAFRFAFNKVFGIDTGIDIIDYQGKTDTQIILEVLQRRGLDERTVRSRISKIMIEMVNFFETNVHTEEFSVLYGVRELLERLEENRVLAGLVTGNLEPIARTKMRKVGLNRYFKVGGFGDSSENRSDLIRIAIRQAERNFGFRYHNNVFSVGDTPRDITAGREAGVKIIAVSTGSYPNEKLKEQNPDFLFRDLTCKEEILKAVLS